MNLNPLARNLRRQQTYAENLLWQKLRNRQQKGVKFRRQQPLGSFIVDFVSYEQMLIIELDGGQHNSVQGKQSDENRSKWLESQGYRIIRFWDNEVINDLETVLQQIYLTLTLSSKEREK